MQGGESHSPLSISTLGRAFWATSDCDWHPLHSRINGGGCGLGHGGVGGSRDASQ